MYRSRRTCHMAGQHRATQRKLPQGLAYSSHLAEPVSELDVQYSRYSYRRNSDPPRADVWEIGAEREERIWKRTRLKVPRMEHKRGRNWQNAGSCVRLRPERRAQRNILCQESVLSHDAAETNGEWCKPDGCFRVPGQEEGAACGSGQEDLLLQQIETSLAQGTQLIHDDVDCAVRSSQRSFNPQPVALASAAACTSLWGVRVAGESRSMRVPPQFCQFFRRTSFNR